MGLGEEKGRDSKGVIPGRYSDLNYRVSEDNWIIRIAEAKQQHIIANSKVDAVTVMRSKIGMTSRGPFTQGYWMRATKHYVIIKDRKMGS